MAVALRNWKHPTLILISVELTCFQVFARGERTKDGGPSSVGSSGLGVLEKEVGPQDVWNLAELNPIMFQLYPRCPAM